MIKIFFFLVLFGGIFYKHRFNNLYLKFLMFILFITITLRNKICFMDTPGYVIDYETLSSINYSSIAKIWIKDISFWYVSKIVSSLSHGNYTVWFAVLGICYVMPLYLLLKKYSKNIQISLLLFCCLGFALFSMTGLRQTLAMSCTMCALYFLLNSRHAYFLSFTILGALFHMTAIVFLILYPLSKFPLVKKYSLFYLAAGIIVYFISLKFLPILMMSDLDSRLVNYIQSESSLNYSGLIQQVLLFSVAIIYLGKNRNTPVNRILIWMSILGIFFQSMTNILPEMFRVSMYFSISNIFLLSNSLSTNKNAAIAKYLIVGALVVYFVTSKNNGFLKDYYFYFQDIPTII